MATTRILYLGFNLPQNIQCHWNVPPNVQEHYARMISERRHGWRLSIVPTRQVSICILWQDFHQPIKGRIEQLLNYYEGIFRILQFVPNYVPSITIETEIPIQQRLLNPNQPEWPMRFQARRLNLVINRFERVHFSLVHPSTVRFIKVITRMFGTATNDVNNLGQLYTSND